MIRPYVSLLRTGLDTIFLREFEVVKARYFAELAFYPLIIRLFLVAFDGFRLLSVVELLLTHFAVRRFLQSLLHRH